MNLTYCPARIDSPSPIRSGDRYLLLLGLALLGYALFARGFAYWGVPPVFVGEIVLGIGIVQLFRASTLPKLAGLPVVWLLCGLVALAVVRMVPYVGVYGIAAPRDSMQILYGLFALIVAALLVERPERIGDLVRQYSVFIKVMLACIGIIYLTFKMAEQSIPYLPWADGVARVFEAKGGDIMVHMAGITVFLMVGLMRRRPLLIAVLVLNAGIIVVSNRGGMVAFIAALAVGFVLRPPDARIGKLAYAFAFFLVIGLIVGPVVQIQGGTRDISVEQLWTNIQSVFGQSESDSLEGTKEWRLDWWDQIYNYTVRGEYFWTGKGFGINLAKDDGFLVAPSLRSPHNGHMTILARMGVPGALLWILLQLAWLATLIRAWWRAREAKASPWMAVFAVLVAYWLAMHLNAAFDVYFEGPMGGIWFWTVFGVGIGAAYVHRHYPHVLSDDNDQSPTPEPLGYAADAPAIEPSRRVAWGWPAPPRPASP